MKVQNTTDISTETIKDIIAFVKPNNLPRSKFTVKTMNSSSSIGSGGICYTEGTEYTDRPIIKVRLSRAEKGYPYVKSYIATKVVKEEWQEPNKKTGLMETWYRKKYVDDPTGKRLGGYIDHLVLTREESLVNTMAHEFRHLWQSNHRGKHGKVWGAKGVISERDASAYGIRKAREWRRLTSPKQIFHEVPW